MADSNLILVVDDNDTSRYGKVRTLHRAGFEVVEAATGGEVLQLVRERSPRLVVLDVHLPDISGLEVCRQLKSDPAIASVLVLQVSATYVRDEDTVRALESGADASLTEPLDPPVLIATVRALLRARQAEDALRDALNREQAARALAESANRAKDEFLATLSHELRSPLGVILTWVTLLRSGRVDETRHPHALEVIERNTRLQVRLIDDLLDVSRIISGKMRLEMGSLDLATVITAALEAVRPAAQSKHIQLEVDVDPGFGPVSGDAARLQQVFWNLFANAIKFTNKGGRVAVGLDTADSKARVRIADTGRGIDPSVLPHIFERFRQADSSSTRSEGGLGLGLAIVRQLVELHGGTVEAESAGVGQGATFTVHLPLPAIRAELQVPPYDVGLATTVPEAPKSLSGLHVLVVDDELDARDAVSAVLEEWGAQVTAMPSVREGIDVLGRNRVDVVVSDIALPGEDGYVFIDRLRQRAVRIPALALTAYGGLAERQRIMSAGFDAVLSKPVAARELVSAVRWLAGRAK
jgi:signal transduction histidine kinase